MEQGIIYDPNQPTTNREEFNKGGFMESMSNPQPEMSISEEASSSVSGIEPLFNSGLVGLQLRRAVAQQVQAAINQSTAPLREEIERLKKTIERQKKIGLYRDARIRILASRHAHIRDGEMEQAISDLNMEEEQAGLYQNEYEASLKNQITQLEKQAEEQKQAVTQLANDLMSADSKCDELSRQLTTKREVLEKCVKHIQDRINNCCPYNSNMWEGYCAHCAAGMITLTLANEELKKGQRE